MKDLLADVKPAIVAVVEPRISGAKARRVARSFKFGKTHIIDPVCRIRWWDLVIVG